ncbi:MAG: hypothetical protein Q3M24_02825 [Candidatus Electrothrix aestuarii]|uniref:Uncharacterized protein n=1 Tax=Candidatus Electrothrix aestuarii TaxID=3062594 RepID=A0AAU8LXU9_9BACT|nr:hypothetical protein [Candidatus Electrothrix aestuarii]
MERDIWLMMVNQSGKGLYKKGHLGREVHEFEIEAALEAQRVFAEMTSTEKIQITCMEFSTPPAGSTYRTITEPIHRKITAAPSHMESAWMNVWHSVAEASFLISVGTPKVMSFIDGAEGTGLAAYLAYCRECRDWVPTPRMFSELSPELQSVWQEVEVIAAKIMSAGFRKLDYHSSQTEH